jgi:hypothetical protein
MRNLGCGRYRSNRVVPIQKKGLSQNEQKPYLGKVFEDLLLLYWNSVLFVWMFCESASEFTRIHQIPNSSRSSTEFQGMTILKSVLSQAHFRGDTNRLEMAQGLTCIDMYSCTVVHSLDAFSIAIRPYQYRDRYSVRGKSSKPLRAELKSLYLSSPPSSSLYACSISVYRVYRPRWHACARSASAPRDRASC